MSLDAIPSGSQALIDANNFTYSGCGKSAQCHRLIARCARGETTGIALAEFCDRRKMQEAQSRGR